jgi:hypothetical protein
MITTQAPYGSEESRMSHHDSPGAHLARSHLTRRAFLAFTAGAVSGLAVDWRGDPFAQLGWYTQLTAAEQRRVIGHASGVYELVRAVPAGSSVVSRADAVQHAYAVLGFYQAYGPDGDADDIRDQYVTAIIDHWRHCTGHRVIYSAANAHIAAVPACWSPSPTTTPSNASSPGAAPSTRSCTSTGSHQAACWLLSPARGDRARPPTCIRRLRQDRPASQLRARFADWWPDGFWLVDLGSVTDPDLVARLAASSCRRAHLPGIVAPRPRAGAHHPHRSFAVAVVACAASARRSSGVRRRRQVVKTSPARATSLSSISPMA